MSAEALIFGCLFLVEDDVFSFGPLSFEGDLVSLLGVPSPEGKAIFDGVAVIGEGISAGTKIHDHTPPR